MKKYLFFGAMVALLLGAASCSSDIEPAMGGEVPVSFAIDLGDNIDSRTISDGLKANTLKFAVFENGTEITALAKEVPVANKQATVTTKLVKGHTYTFVFWAQNSACTAYDTDDMSAIKVDYTSVNSNDESRDAFYKMDSFKVTEAFEKTEVLTRPFAQINFLADDAAGVVNVDAYKSKVTVTGVPTTLNTLDGTVAGSTAVTFDYATIPNETLAGYADYKYVAMNYILAATDKEMKNEVVLTVNDGTQDVNTVTVANCPVQRNYRTNIFGSLFTLEGKFNVVIDPFYEGEYLIVNSKEELIAALQHDGIVVVNNDINMGSDELHFTNNNTLILNATITAQSWKIIVEEGADLTIEGNGGIDVPKGALDIYGKATVKGGTYTSTIKDSGAVLWVNPSGELIFEDGLIDAARAGIVNEGTATIHGGVIKSSSMMKNGTNMWSYTVITSGPFTMNGGWIDGIHGALSVEGDNAIINDGYLTTHDYYENGIAQNQNHYALFVGNAINPNGSVKINGGHFYVEPTRNLPCIYTDAADGLSALPVTVNAGYFNNLGLNNFLASQGVTALDEPIQDSEHNATYSYGKQSISGTGENPGNTPGPDPDIPMP